MEIIGDAIGNNSVSRIVTALAAGADIDIVTENVNKLALAFVTPDGTKHDCRHDGGWDMITTSAKKLQAIEY